MLMQKELGKWRYCRWCSSKDWCWKVSRRKERHGLFSVIGRKIAGCGKSWQSLQVSLSYRLKLYFQTHAKVLIMKFVCPVVIEISAGHLMTIELWHSVKIVAELLVNELRLSAVNPVVPKIGDLMWHPQHHHYRCTAYLAATAFGEHSKQSQCCQISTCVTRFDNFSFTEKKSEPGDKSISFGWKYLLLSL